MTEQVLLQALLGPEGPPTVWVASGRIKDASAAARRVFGPALALGVPVVPLFDEESRGKVEAALAGGQPKCIEVNVPTPGAPPVSLRFLVVPQGEEAVLISLGASRESSSGLYDHLRTLLAANDQLTNLTRELSVRTRELTVAREQLQALNELREQDAATLSHDIKSPLNAIELQARGLERPATSSNPELVRERAGAIRRTVRVLLGLVTNVLDGVRLDTGKLELEREPLALGEVVKQVVEALSAVAEHAGVRLERVAGEDMDTRVRADRSRLFQALANLADNAVRYSPKGGVVTLAVRGLPDRVRCTVMDHGPGVPPEDRERIFERLYQGDGRRKGAAGLGLNIARQLIELHGGKLWVEESPGGGATFVLELPPA